jgi:hypothetical protein
MTDLSAIKAGARVWIGNRYGVRDLEIKKEAISYANN